MSRTRYRLVILGVELGAIVVDTPKAPRQEAGEETVAHRHSGDFGFGHLPGPSSRDLPSDIEAVR